ncbi:sulfatase-like hydrolase/transferase [uncultured Pseudoteredinibacter sp.]|uniref:sulfatase family protein n=1 Tax=uncultured Pseudoteredinibacter sp. TaxID=1641701 RepID=UPI0026363237|nr:sulfatase-like hydrolase/transferase [uncultured Pseudoteredinibacter sp.]
MLIRVCQALLALLLCPAYVAVQAADNIVMVVIDNVPAKMIGSYGNKYIATPNIDQLANEGLQLDQAFASSGVCSPTRATLLSGLMPSQNGVHNALPSEVGLKEWSALAEYPSLPGELSKAGYKTALIGKYHLGTPEQAQMSFDHWVTFASGHTSSFHNMAVIDNGKQYRSEKHLTDYWTDKAVDFIAQQDKQQPFFLYLSYNGPYLLPPLVLEEPQNRYADYYRRNPVPTAKDPLHPYLENFVSRALQSDDGGGEFLKGWRAEEGHKSRWAEVAWGMVKSLNNPTAMRHAASELSMVDEGIGRVMQALKAQGLDKDTLIVFTSDQGASLGEHGLWGNSSASLPTAAYDENMNVPLILRHPGKIKVKKSKEPVNQFDLAPSLLAYVGLDAKQLASSPGRDLSRFFKGQAKPAKPADIIFEYMRTRAIRSDGWKLVKRFPGGPNELYQISSDPGEYHNLIEQAAYQSKATELTEKLRDFFDRHASPEFDVWKGGTGRAVLEYGGRNEFYQQYFPNWQKPFVRSKAAKEE